MKRALPLSAFVFLLALVSTGASGGWERAGAAAPPTRMVTICKQTCPLGGTNFQFTRSNTSGPLPSFTLNGGQCVTYDLTNQDTANTFKENVPAGWTLTNISCNNTTTPVKFTGANSNPAFQAGDNTVSLDVIEPNVTCVFTNERACTPKPAGMVSWWTGDGDPSDLVAGGVNGTAFGPLTYPAGKVARTFEFFGNGYVEVPDNPVHIPAGSFTVDAWVKPHGFVQGGRMMVVSKYECGGVCLNISQSTYQLAVLSGKADATIRDTDAGGIVGGQGQNLTGPFVADGGWHHLAMVRDVATKEFLLYVDGALVNSAPLNSGANSTLKDEDLKPDPLYIGAMKKAGPSFQPGGVANMEHFFLGMIDEVEYFNRALSAGEIALIYNAGAYGKCKN